MNFKVKSFYVGVKAIITDPDRGTLLVHRTDNEYKFWEVPGGRINGDESFDQALTRELHEELLNLGSLAVGDYLGALELTGIFQKITALFCYIFLLKLNFRKDCN